MEGGGVTGPGREERVTEGLVVGYGCLWKVHRLAVGLHRVSHLGYPGDFCGNKVRFMVMVFHRQVAYVRSVPLWKVHEMD